MPYTLKKMILGAVLSCFALGAGSAVSAKPAQKSAAVRKAPVKKAAAKPVRKPAAAKVRTAQKKTAKRAKSAAAVPAAGLKRASMREVRIPEEQKLAQQLRMLPPSSGSLQLTAASALMFDQDTGRVLFEKNADVQLPMASLTKLMSALVVMRSNLPMNELFTVEREDFNLPSSSFSRLRVGMTFSRDDLLHLGLMGSDNRAIHLLARSYPGGMDAFVAKMNETAREMGLKNTHFAEPTGLSSENHTTAREITRVAAEAYRYPKIREYSTSPKIEYFTQSGLIQVRSTNRLIREGHWDIGMQKTGYTGAAGHCMMLQTEVAGSRVLMVVLNSTSSANRVTDMKRMKDWYEKQTGEKAGASRRLYNLM